MSLAKQLWRGDIPLGTTYWLFGAGPNIVLFATRMYLESDKEFAATPEGTSIALGLTLFGAAYAVFIGVAIWRSATKYQGQQWLAVLAKVAVVLGWMRLLSDLLSSVLVPQAGR